MDSETLSAEPGGFQRWVPGIAVVKRYQRSWLRFPRGGRRLGGDLGAPGHGYRWEAPLFFANAGIFRQEIRKLVQQRKPRWVVLQCEAITDIDVTAADMLDKLDKELNTKNVNVVFVEMRSRIQDLLERYGLFATFTREHVYPSVDIAVREIREEESSAVMNSEQEEGPINDG